MQGILIGTGVGLIVALFGTPLLINWFVRHGIGQPIREDGPITHHRKQGTPTMGGLVLLVAATAGYLAAHVRVGITPLMLEVRTLTAPGLIALCATLALGLLGMADDIKKVRRRRSLGINKRVKIAGQAAVGIPLAIMAVRVGVEPAVTISGLHAFPRMPVFLFAIWVLLLIAAASNAVNLTDGLDGLACGSSAMSLFVFVIIAFWEARNPGIYPPLGAEPKGTELADVAIVAAALLGACIGFLWWNAPSARIIMGDTGSLALGGALAALALMTRTQLLLVAIGGLFVIETLSVMIQIVSYRLFNKRRVFAMAPLHHHFELRGWEESTVIVRFWLIAALSAGFGLALFYQDFLRTSGSG